MKQAVFKVIRRFHLAFADRGLPAKIAVYLHSIEPRQYGDFSRLVEELGGLGYSFCGPDEYVRADRKVAYVSFDDNYRSWVQALGLFDRLKVRATFFVNTLPISDRAAPNTIKDFYRRIQHEEDCSALSAAEIRSLADAGHTVATHSHSHFNLAALPFEKATEEIFVSRTILQDILGRPVRHLSYPFGMRRYFTPALRAWSRKVGFATVSNGIPGGLHADIDAFNIYRTGWDFRRPHDLNMRLLRVDGRWFERFTGKSPVG